jgi:integrase
MPLEMRKTSKWWYGRFNVKGRAKVLNLDVEIKGIRPPSVTQEGDPTFERSRGRAQAKLEQLIRKAGERKHAEDLVQTLHEIRTGNRISSIPLPEMAEAWKRIPRKRPMSNAYVKSRCAVLRCFVDFIAKTHPTVKEMADVNRAVAQEFLEAEEKREISPRTWNAELTLLKSAFHHLRRAGGLVENPFADVPKKVEDTVHRRPFEPDKLKSILEHARNHPFIRPIIITGCCTAMRRGDCCLLKWSDVDLKSRFVQVKTSKTGETIEIPMFPLLYDELAATKRTTSKYVFPEQAEMYRSNPDGITKRVRKVLAAAGFSDDGSEAQKVTVHRNPDSRRVSIRDFHSFRVTWVTLALSAGVPLELVQKVTGHRTAEIVLKHYFRPGREEFRHAIQSAMPQLLVAGGPTRDQQIRNIVENMTPKTCKRDKKKILELMTDV